MLRGDTDLGAPSFWLRDDGSGQRDQTFANFMERVEQVAIAGFRNRVAPESLDVFLLIEYFNEDDELMGFTELSRFGQEGPYFVRSERTRVHAEAFTQSSSTVEQDLQAIF